MLSAGSAATLPLWPLYLNEVALFLDFDGTIVDIVMDPGAVRVDDASILNLTTLWRRLGGALAIVSGRSIAEIDEHLKPLVLPVAGVHGLTRRASGGQVEMASVDESIVGGVATMLEPFVYAYPGLILEPKWGAIALHYRARPELAEACYAALAAATATYSPSAEIVHGKMVVEAKFARFNKGTAVRSFAAESPFNGRRPIFIGDDVTDEDGFAAVIEMGGVAAKVGTGPSVATTRFKSAAEFRKWMGLIANQPEG